MTEYGEFWCEECRTYYPDPLEELHKESHRNYQPSHLPSSDNVLITVLAMLMVLVFILTNVRP